MLSLSSTDDRGVEVCQSIVIYFSVALLTMPIFSVMSTLIGLCGMVMYATYADCDPLLSGQVERMDQVRVTLGLTHLPLDKMAVISQTTFSNALQWKLLYLDSNFTAVCS